ncbi:MAG TPA: CGNR zinc finger domain-containing protein [Thermoleophilaceae bacterium]|nr:CGNR zinc finger domain-containing protein [Thermoleophilaceae bacterium]
MEDAFDYRAGPQSGGREPAPGELGLVQAFVNSHYDLEHEHGSELLHSPSALGTWLEARGLLERGRAARLSRSDLRRALDIREGLRSMLAANNGAAWDEHAVAKLNRAAGARPAVLIQFHRDGPSLELYERDIDGAFALLLGIVARAQLDGRWTRFKACPGDDCGWAFYDYSRNQASAWCSMSVCGSRSKARAYRQRNRRRGL